jgi:general secretion pathway protein G
MCLVVAAPRIRHKNPSPRRPTDETQHIPLAEGKIQTMQNTNHALQICSRRRVCGFTLLELLVVVVIIGLLVSYVGPRYFSQVGKSEVGTAKAQIDAIEKALDQYRLDTGRYPGAELGLGALFARPSNEPKWNGPYLKKAVPQDPWGKDYVYKIPGERGEYDLLSYGKDGQPGGTGDNADITNY